MEAGMEAKIRTIMEVKSGKNKNKNEYKTKTKK